MSQHAREHPDEPIRHCWFSDEQWTTAPLTGWLCPKCGRGNSPFVTVCECGPSYRITSSGVTTEDINPTKL